MLRSKRILAFVSKNAAGLRSLCILLGFCLYKISSAGSELRRVDRAHDTNFVYNHPFVMFKKRVELFTNSTEDKRATFEHIPECLC